MLANPEQFGETKPGEATLVVSYLWTRICCARSESGMCLFSLTPDMLPEWMGSSLPGFHIPSLFPNGSSTLWYRDMVAVFFLLTMPLMQLEAPPHSKQMHWAPPGLPKCSAQLWGFFVCPKSTTSLIQFGGILHPDFSSLPPYWDDFTPGDRIAFWFSTLCR